MAGAKDLAVVLIMQEATISHPVRKPRYGLIAGPTHLNEAPQSHSMLHRRKRWR
jgi:hypothetical protein